MPTITIELGSTPKIIMAIIDVINGAPAFVKGDTIMAFPYLKANTSASAPKAFRIWMPAAK